MFEPGKKALIKYCFDSMLTAAHVFAFAEQEGYSGPRTTASKDLLIQRISKDKGCLLTVRALQSYCRKHWVNPPTAIHLANLKSGKLKGHSWNGAFPKTVHDRLQRFARMVCAGELALDEYLAMGDQIVAHEYFMVAIADLCEGLIIDHFDAFPPLMTRSVSDFVLNGMPYDLKCTSPTKEWPFARIVKDPIGYARGMFGGGQ